MDEDSDEISARITAATGADIPHLYFNSHIAVGNGRDILLCLEQNRHPVATINVPLTEAKTLAESLTRYIDHLEQRTGRKIITAQDLVALARQERDEDR